MRRIVTYLAAFATAFSLMAQETATTPLHFDMENLKSYITLPVRPQITFTSPNIVTPNLSNFKMPEPLKLDFKISKMPDSIKAMPEITADYQPMHVDPVYNFHGNPYSRDWSASGIITEVGNGLYLTGSGGYTSLPAMGTIGSATVGLMGTIDERLTLAAGVTGAKYHFDHSIWNDYGFYANACYKLNDRFDIKAFGNFSLNPLYHSMASMSYLQSGNYGATLGIKFSEKVGLDVGVQRYYDPYSRTWRTLPVVAPSINLFGQPISVDVGGIIYELMRGVLQKDDNYYTRFKITPTAGGGVPIRSVEPRLPSNRAAGAAGATLHH